VYGSGYGVWPLFLLLSIVNLQLLEMLIKGFPWKAIAIVCISFLTLLLGIKVYAIELSYPVTDISGELEMATKPNLQGLSTPGGYISRFEDLVSYVQTNIPQNDSVIFLPGEDPFFSVTKRKNPLPFDQYHPATLPLSDDQIITKIRSSNARWIIVKQLLQTNWYVWQISVQPILNSLSNDYSLHTSLPGYDIYKRNSLH